MSDIGSSAWSEAAASNDATPPDGWPEQMNASSVNDCGREMMAAIKRLYDQFFPTLTTSGTSTAYTLTSATQGEAAYHGGQMYSFVLDEDCGDDATLNINSLGAKNIRKFTDAGWVNVEANDLKADQVVTVRYNSTDTKFDIVSVSVLPAQRTQGVPTGASMPFRGTSSQVPDGWALEDGGTIGDSSSGATNVAGDEAEALFKLLWANSNYTLQDSDGGATTKGDSASDDWSAHKRLVLTNMSDKFRRGATVTPGGAGGSDTHTHTVSTSVSVFGSGTFTSTGNSSWFTLGNLNGGASNTFPSQNHTHNVSVSLTSTGSGSGTAASGSNVPAYVYELSIVKL